MMRKGGAQECWSECEWIWHVECEWRHLVNVSKLNVIVNQGPVHTNPFSNENGAVLLRIRLSSTLQRRKRSHSETLSRVQRFEDDAFWKRCFLVWTEKTVLSENGDVIKIDTTGRQTTRPWVSKNGGQMLPCGFNIAGWYIEMRMRRVHLSMRTEGIKAFSKRIRRCSVDGRNDTKTISVDANLFENGAKQLRFRLKTD